MATYFMTTEFLDEITSNPDKLAKLNAKYHIAEKKIALYDRATKKSVKPTANTGIKFELFCFDCFDQAKSFGLFQIDRDEEFAPVKNATGEDSPETARLLISKLHHKWLQPHAKIKGKIWFNTDEPNSSDKLCEIDCLLSYDGEGLEHLTGKYEEATLPLYVK
jgi:UDP-N-acetylglucosamine/UDP-N-acetylgalactosamine diphosphorylase